MKDTVNEIECVMDTGEWRKDVLDRLQSLAAEIAEIKRMEEEGRKERETRWSTLKRGVMQIVKGWGWVE